MTEPGPTDKGNDEARKKSRRNFLLMAAIGFVPLFAAYFIFFFLPHLAPSGTTNEGTLIQPPLSVEALGEPARQAIPQGKWTFIIASGSDCGDACRKAIYLARQIDIGVGKDSDRVQRILVMQASTLTEALNATLLAEYPDMIVDFDPAGSAARALGGALESGTLDGKLFLADPNGNIILYFDQADGGKPILHDLKHLLRLSNIG